ncbi:MAG TPA: DNA gyrase subunit A, partial [Polyangia bacterium]|nr:DNA gyrase subunit A [Polyangia bacterium]
MGTAAAPLLETDLREAAEERYLSYALSVITSRALPDVRDGLKPVQRRILYAMYQNLRLTAGARPRKSAAVVGEVLGKYHPHGDLAAYEAMVRMAQPFALRYPLVHGEGNFGSVDGDGAAAMRYTEARLTALAEEMLSDLGAETVAFRANYDATQEEPIVLPSAIPQLLMNGSTGIAVGMATNIPPHNLRELVAALVAMIEEPDIDVKGLLKHVKGPDFPTGGEILNARKELREIYETGQGPIR